MNYTNPFPVADEGDVPYMEYQPGKSGELVPIRSFGMNNFVDMPGRMGPIRRVGSYELPRFQYLPWHPKDRVEGMPTEMPQELKVPPNVPRNSPQFREWLAARAEWEKYLYSATTPEDAQAGEDSIRRWEIQQELKNEKILEEERRKKEREDRIRENIRRQMRGQPMLEEEEAMAAREKQEAEREARFREMLSRHRELAEQANQRMNRAVRLSTSGTIQSRI